MLASTIQFSNNNHTQHPHTTTTKAAAHKHRFGKTPPTHTNKCMPVDVS